MPRLFAPWSCAECSMVKFKRIKVGKKYIEALLYNLFAKNLIILKGFRGYIMCGYLNLKAAEKSKDAAAKIVGVSSIEEAMQARIHSCTKYARKLGIYKEQPVREAVKLLV